MNIKTQKIIALTSILIISIYLFMNRKKSYYSLDDIVYKRATESDLNEVHALEDLCYDSEEQKKLRPISFKKTMLVESGDFFMLARDKKTNDLVGVIYANPIKGNPQKSTLISNIKDGETLFTQSFCVHPDTQGTGIGTAMSDYFNNEWVFGGKGGPKTKQITRVVASATSDLDNLMKRNGFTKIGESEFKFNGKPMYDWERNKST
jgi:ribosomal protein S18 acetylase RimI-like enzyme